MCDGAEVRVDWVEGDAKGVLLDWVGWDAVLIPEENELLAYDAAAADVAAAATYIAAVAPVAAAAAAGRELGDSFACSSYL